MSHWAAQYGELLVENSAQGILLTDHMFTILHANPRASDVLGAQDAGQLAGLRLHAGQEEGGIRLEKDFLDGENPVDGRYTLVSKFGSEMPADLRFLPVSQDLAADDAAYLVLILDCSRQVDLERTVLQSEKLAALDNIVAGIAHELNNPMTAILGYAELLLATEQDPKRKQRMASIAEYADRCGKIIGNMLAFTRSYGKALESANLNAILEEVLSLQGYQLRVDQIAVQGFYDRDIPVCQLLPAGLRRLFLNVIHNAHQALLEVPEDQRALWVETERRGDDLFVQIADSGPGIPKDIRHKIFDPFFTTRSLGEGMGLGLSVAYGIVQEHGGEIWMEPRDGGGTEIHIRLPVRMGGA